MGLKRDEFRDRLEFGPGEDYLGAWHCQEVPLDDRGRVFLGGMQGEPETFRRELVLSNYRVRYVGPGGLELEIPLTAISEVTLIRHPTRAQDVLSLSVYAIMEESDSSGRTRDFPAWRKLGFLLDEREDSRLLLQRLSAANELAGAQADNLPSQPEHSIDEVEGFYEPAPEPGDPPAEDPRSSPAKARRDRRDGGSDDIVQFHAEQEP
jgi:hypothetical protein